MRASDAKPLVKLLIVDDEPIICEGLRLTIDWEELGVVVVGVAYDGEEALRMTKEYAVDFLLSDIRMEGMDGLELVEQLRKDMPHVRVVMISGYEDFEYARQAIRLGVTDYLLKPVDIDELVKVVKGIVDGMVQQDSDPGSDDDVGVLWLSGMVHETPSYIQVTPPQRLRGYSYRVIASQFMNFTESFAMLSDWQFQEVQQQWSRFIHDQLSLSGIRSIAVFDHKNLLYTLAISESKQGDEYWRQLLEGIHQDWSGGSRLCCGISEEFNRLEDTSAHSIKAKELLQYQVLQNHSAILAGDQVGLRQMNASLEHSYKQTVQKLVTALFKQNVDEVRSLIDDLFRIFIENQLLLHKVVTIYDELLVLLRQRLRQSGLSEIERDRTSQIDLNVNNSYASIKAIVMNDMQQLMQRMDQDGIDKSYWVIEKAKQYMTEHYHDDLKASEVAAWLKITPGYFSIIFKQSTGKSFKEYMNELRIEDAKLLLATTHDKVFEIANKIGYKEYKYFVSVFKLYTGMTPKEYRSLKASQ